MNESFEDFFNRRSNAPPFSPSLFLWGIGGILLVIGLFSSFYKVPAESNGVVLRFGKFIKTEKSGLHFKIPFGVEKVDIIPVTRMLKQEFGFGTPGATNPNQYSKSSTEQLQERNMVTGDLNAATVEWVIQFRIEDPKRYLFSVREPADTLRDVSESVMRTVVGDRTVDEVITIGRQGIETEAKILLTEAVAKYELGLVIDQVQLKNVNPPKPVQPSFNEVNQAQQQREQLINEANGEYNKAVPRARGEADQKIQAAEGYALKRINEAQGDVARFVAMLDQYVKAPEVTRQRIYLETMKDTIPKLGKKIIIDDDAKQILPLLNLDGGKR